MWQIRHFRRQKPWTCAWKRTPKFSASLIGTGMCLPKQLKKKHLSFTMKWPLTWGKRERMFLINQFYLDSSWTWLWNEATSFSYTLKNTMTFCVKNLQNETKSFWKIFEKVCQTSNKIYQFYLKTKLNWISEKCITIQCSLKVPEGSFFFIFIASVPSTQRIPGFSMWYFWIIFNLIWIKHGDWKRKTVQKLLNLTELTLILHLKEGTKTQPFLVTTRIVCANTKKKNYEFYPIRTVH